MRDTTYSRIKTELKLKHTKNKLLSVCADFEEAQKLLQDPERLTEVTDPLSFFFQLAQRFPEVLGDILNHELFSSAFLAASLDSLTLPAEFSSVHGFSSQFIYRYFALCMKKCFSDEKDKKKDFIFLIRQTVISLFEQDIPEEKIFKILQLAIEEKHSARELNLLLNGIIYCIVHLTLKDKKTFGLDKINLLLESLNNYSEDFTYLCELPTYTNNSRLSINIFFSYLAEKARRKLQKLKANEQFKIELKVSFFNSIDLFQEYQRQYGFSLISPQGIHTVFVMRIMVDKLIEKIMDEQLNEKDKALLLEQVYEGLFLPCYEAGDLEVGYLIIKNYSLSKQGYSRIKPIWFRLIDEGYKVNECLEFGKNLEENENDFFDFKDIQRLIELLSEYRNDIKKTCNLHKYERKDKIVGVNYSLFVAIIVNGLRILYQDFDSGEAGLLWAQCIVEGLFRHASIEEPNLIDEAQAQLLLNELNEAGYEEETCQKLRIKLLTLKEEAKTEPHTPPEVNEESKKELKCCMN